MREGKNLTLLFLLWWERGFFFFQVLLMSFNQYLPWWHKVFWFLATSQWSCLILIMVLSLFLDLALYIQHGVYYKIVVWKTDFTFQKSSLSVAQGFFCWYGKTFKIVRWYYLFLKPSSWMCTYFMLTVVFIQLANRTVSKTVLVKYYFPSCKHHFPSFNYRLQTSEFDFYFTASSGNISSFVVHDECVTVSL